MRLAIVLLLAASTASANCASRDYAVTYHRDQWGETVQSLGLDRQGMVLEVWANLVSGTWSVTVTRPDGVTCLIASGDNFEPVNEPGGVEG